MTTFPAIDQAYIDRLVIFMYEKNLNLPRDGRLVPMLVSNICPLQDGIIDYARDKGIEIFIDNRPPLPPPLSGDYRLDWTTPDE